jgi:hypothetical protein
LACEISQDPHGEWVCFGLRPGRLIRTFASGASRAQPIGPGDPTRRESLPCKIALRGVVLMRGGFLLALPASDVA